MNIVWFKRDLRLSDHQPLLQAIQSGPTVLLYILEPTLWQQPDMSYRHYLFLTQCLTDLIADANHHHGSLIIRVGNAESILEQLRVHYGTVTLFSHEETWNDWTYRRDQAIRRWANVNHITWNEYQPNGVIRRLSNRDGWSRLWATHMAADCGPMPSLAHTVTIDSDPLPTADTLGLSAHPDLLVDQLPVGGRIAALATLETFLTTRGHHYSKHMSSPLTAWTSCSRLSPYIAFGTLSIREIMHALNRQLTELSQGPRGNQTQWRRSLRAFAGRLRWHCHFIQKMEDEPSIEYEPMHSAYRSIRTTSNDAKLTAWKTGHTGYPMVDACMRACIATGWLNFRMRAMLASFASYHLWLPWQETAPYLAQLFIDYEPGIHYSQFQMQSGTTGINTIRMYNPIKQGHDHDPDGEFVRRWVPELSHLSTDAIHTPWMSPECPSSYPQPIVNESEARRQAASILYSLRSQSDHRSESDAIVTKHGSRKSRSNQSKSKRTTRSKQSNQMELPL